MKYLERLSKTIFKLAVLPFLKKIRSKSIEAVLKDSLLLLTDETADEIRHFIRQKQNPDGGFADRAGKSDLYYSLFGYLVAEALSVNEIIGPLKEFVKNEITRKNLSGVHLYCGAILYSKLCGADDHSVALEKKVLQELKSANPYISTSIHQHISTSIHQHIEYSSFMGFLALYYLENFFALKNLIKNYKVYTSAHQHINTSPHQHINPCPVMAANAILQELSRFPDPSSEEKLMSFHHENGGFIAVLQAPCEDLLSTGVALYALKFINADLRVLKPQCLSFVDNLYEDGGFRAAQTDFETDVEYTFYGLLALGSLK